MTWPDAIVLLGAMFATAFLVGYLVHLFVYYRLEYEPPEESTKDFSRETDLRRRPSTIGERPGDE